MKKALFLSLCLLSVSILQAANPRQCPIRLVTQSIEQTTSQLGRPGVKVWEKEGEPSWTTFPNVFANAVPPGEPAPETRRLIELVAAHACAIGSGAIFLGTTICTLGLIHAMIVFGPEHNMGRAFVATIGGVMALTTLPAFLDCFDRARFLTRNMGGRLRDEDRLEEADFETLVTRTNDTAKKKVALLGTLPTVIAGNLPSTSLSFLEKALQELGYQSH